MPWALSALALAAAAIVADGFRLRTAGDRSMATKKLLSAKSAEYEDSNVIVSRWNRGGFTRTGQRPARALQGEPATRVIRHVDYRLVSEEIPGTNRK